MLFDDGKWSIDGVLCHIHHVHYELKTVFAPAHQTLAELQSELEEPCTSG